MSMQLCEFKKVGPTTLKIFVLEDLDKGAILQIAMNMTVSRIAGLAPEQRVSNNSNFLRLYVIDHRMH